MSPLLQSPRREIKLIVRTRNEPAAAMPAIRAAMREIDPRLPLGDVRTMAQVKQLTMAAKTRAGVDHRGVRRRSRHCSRRWASTACSRTR